LRDSRYYGATRLYKMFYEKRWNIHGLKALIKKVVGTGTIEQLLGIGHPQWTNMHFRCKSYSYSPKSDMLYVMYFAAVSL